MFHVISDHDLSQLRGDLAQALKDLRQVHEDLAKERVANGRLHRWNTHLAGRVKWHEDFLATGLPQEIARPLHKVHRLRYANAHLRSTIAQLRLQLEQRPALALPGSAAAEATPGPVPVPVPPVPAAGPGEDTELIPVIGPDVPEADVVRLGSWAWATDQQIADLRAHLAS